MALLLNVPYKEKDEAKALGAKWNAELKKWYVPEKENYGKFNKWIVKDDERRTIICDYIYLVEGKRECFKCKKETRVITFGIKEYYNFWCTNNRRGSNYYNNNFKVIREIDPLPKDLLEMIQQKYNYQMTFSKTTKSAYFANRCDYCDKLQGAFHLFEEPSSPFNAYTVEKAQNLIIYKIPLKYDLNVEVINCGIDGKNYINEYAEFRKLDLLL